MERFLKISSLSTRAERTFGKERTNRRTGRQSASVRGERTSSVDREGGAKIGMFRAGIARPGGIFEPKSDRKKIRKKKSTTMETPVNFPGIPEVLSNEREIEPQTNERTLTRGMSENQFSEKMGKTSTKSGISSEFPESYAQLKLSPSDCSVQSEHIPIKRAASIGASRQLSRRDIFNDFQHSQSVQIGRFPSIPSQKIRAERDIIFDSSCHGPSPSEHRNNSTTRPKSSAKSKRRASAGDISASSRINTSRDRKQSRRESGHHRSHRTNSSSKSGRRSTRGSDSGSQRSHRSISSQLPPAHSKSFDFLVLNDDSQVNRINRNSSKEKHKVQARRGGSSASKRSNRSVVESISSSPTDQSISKDSSNFQRTNRGSNSERVRRSASCTGSTGTRLQSIAGSSERSPQSKCVAPGRRRSTTAASIPRCKPAAPSRSRSATSTLREGSINAPSTPTSRGRSLNDIPVTTPEKQKLTINPCESFPSPFEADPAPDAKKKSKRRTSNAAAAAMVLESPMPRRRGVQRSNSLQHAGGRVQRNAMRERRPSLQPTSTRSFGSPSRNSPKRLIFDGGNADPKDERSRRSPRNKVPRSPGSSQSAGTHTTEGTSVDSPQRVLPRPQAPRMIPELRRLNSSDSNGTSSSKGSLSGLRQIKPTRRVTMSSAIDFDTQSVVSSLSRMRTRRSSMEGNRSGRRPSNVMDFQW